jgi:two-component system OmpR family response regulator
LLAQDSAEAKQAPEGRLLVVDDDFDIRDSLSALLEREGFAVQVAADAAAARRLISLDPPDLVLLDVMMPGEDGMSLGRHIAELKSIPVIFLSARSGIEDRLAGFGVGADDYVCKPFSPRELLARIRVALRRSEPDSQVSAPVRETTFFTFDRWTLDVARRRLVRDDAVVFPLSASEFRLLKAFLDRPRFVLTRERLLELTRPDTGEVFDRSIDSQISRFRRKLERDPRSPTLLQTVRGDGYVFNAEVRRL